MLENFDIYFWKYFHVFEIEDMNRFYSKNVTQRFCIELRYILGNLQIVPKLRKMPKKFIFVVKIRKKI